MLDTLAPWLRRECLRTLCRICGREVLLPRSVQIPLCYNQTGAPLYYGGFSEVWKGRHEGREVSVKVLRVRPTSGSDKVMRVSYQCHCQSCDGKLIARNIEVLQRGFNLESSLPSKRASTVGSYHGGTVSNGIGMDGKWKYYRIHQGKLGCESVEACTTLLGLMAICVTNRPL